MGRPVQYYPTRTRRCLSRPRCHWWVRVRSERGSSPAHTHVSHRSTRRHALSALRTCGARDWQALRWMRACVSTGGAQKQLEVLGTAVAGLCSHCWRNLWHSSVVVHVASAAARRVERRRRDTCVADRVSARIIEATAQTHGRPGRVFNAGGVPWPSSRWVCDSRGGVYCRHVRRSVRSSADRLCMCVRGLRCRGWKLAARSVGQPSPEPAGSHGEVNSDRTRPPPPPKSCQSPGFPPRDLPHGLSRNLDVPIATRDRRLPYGSGGAGFGRLSAGGRAVRPRTALGFPARVFRVVSAIVPRRLGRGGKNVAG